MKYIESIKLKSRLILLFILITLGLFSIAILGYININSMKKNIDSLYFGSLMPVTELNDIMQIYNNNVFKVVNNMEELNISPSEIASEIERKTEYASKLWGNYKSHFKRYAERDYVEYATKEIEMTNIYLLKIAHILEDGKEVNKLLKKSVEKKVLHINDMVKKLISYEVDMARYDRKNFLNSYEHTLLQLKVILTLIILAVLVASRYVFKSIATEHFKLNITTKKLEKANKKLENASYTDSLTSLNNRRYFNKVYEREFKRAKRSGSHVTFMMLDIDYFKQYNDTYGHIQGDEALKNVASVLQDTLRRPTDFVFRLGGEEFGVLLTQTDEENSAKLAQKIGSNIKAQKIKHENSLANEFLTISIGIVCCDADTVEDENMILSKADKMLYMAKENGRDRYILTNNVEEKA